MSDMNAREYKKAYDELRLAQEIRAKRSNAKILFITGFCGVGALKLNSDLNQIILYAVPLITVMFDLQGIASTVRIKELEYKSNPTKAAEPTVSWSQWIWSLFDEKLYFTCNWLSHHVFTAVAFVIPFVLLWKNTNLCFTHFFWYLFAGWKGWVFFVLPLLIFVIFRLRECHVKRRIAALYPSET